MLTPKPWTEPHRKSHALCVALLALGCPLAHAWLSVPLSDEIFAALNPADLTQLTLQGPQGQSYAAALCRQRPTRSLQTRRAPALAVSHGGRAVVGPAGELVESLASGAASSAPWPQYVLDLRQLDGAISALQLPAEQQLHKLTLRSSPDLRQWSNRRQFRLAGNTLILDEAADVNWLAIEHPAGWMTNPDALEVSVQIDSGAELHWFAVNTNDKGQFENPRPLPLRGARNPSAQLRSFQVASRVGPWDAWKSRGVWRAGTPANELVFDRVGDPQWQLQASPMQTEGWEVAHEAMELRLDAVAALPLSISLSSRALTSRTIDCGNERWPHEQRTLAAPPRIEAGDLTRDTRQKNLRPYALLALLLGTTVFLIRRRFQARRKT